MSTEKFTKLALRLAGEITHLGLHWRGEPCLHPRLPELARIARKTGFKPWLSTNTAVPNLGDQKYVNQLLSNLDWIEICVDGYNAETAPIYRVGANWDTIKHNLEVIGKTRTDCIKKMRVLMFKHNDGKEELYRNMAKKYDIDELIFAQPLINLKKVLSTREVKEWLSTNEKYQRYHLESGKWIRTTGSCHPSPIISVHGTVHPCCIDWELEHPLGDLATVRWRTIMEKYEKLVPTLGEQKMCELCCVPGQRVNFGEKII